MEKFKTLFILFACAIAMIGCGNRDKNPAEDPDSKIYPSVWQSDEEFVFGHFTLGKKNISPIPGLAVTVSLSAEPCFMATAHFVDSTRLDLDVHIGAEFFLESQLYNTSYPVDNLYDGTIENCKYTLNGQTLTITVPEELGLKVNTFSANIEKIDGSHVKMTIPVAFLREYVNMAGSVILANPKLVVEAVKMIIATYITDPTLADLAGSFIDEDTVVALAKGIMDAVNELKDIQQNYTKVTVK